MADIMEVMARRKHARFCREQLRWDYRGYTETQIREMIDADWATTSEHYLREARKAYESVEAAVGVCGYVIAPKVPTEGMLEAYSDAADDIDGPAAMHLQPRAYTAMIESYQKDVG